eukprot:COSAG01_NODE_6269_length_3761_cov_3.088725_2_plen_97_part_00
MTMCTISSTEAHETCVLFFPGAAARQPSQPSQPVRPSILRALSSPSEQLLLEVQGYVGRRLGARLLRTGSSPTCAAAAATAAAVASQYFLTRTDAT